MQKRIWVLDSDTQTVNRFEIRLGQYVSAPYGYELVHSRHNTEFAVLVELSRLKSREARERERSCLRNSLTSFERANVVTAVEHVEQHDEGYWPAQVIRTERWFTQAREYGSVAVSRAQAGWKSWL